LAQAEGKRIFDNPVPASVANGVGRTHEPTDLFSNTRPGNNILD
jgi:hypothetical protein